MLGDYVVSAGLPDQPVQAKVSGVAEWGVRIRRRRETCQKYNEAHAHDPLLIVRYADVLSLTQDVRGFRM